jgi:tetratricopeptide (TPR) repeat protein
VIAALLALAVAAVDPCAAVEPAGVADPAAAAAYREVAEEEGARGNLDAAIVAYRAALARDPADERSRESLGRLCAARRAGEDPLQRGLALMDAGDWRGAVQAFREARAATPSPSTALLQGICHYELGEDAEATERFREAEAHAPHREEARFYLGLLALRAGAGSAASTLFESARGNAALERAAADLARLARQEGRFVVSLLAESGWDSNVNLAPTGEPSLTPESDGVWALSGSALFRPRGARGPYLRAAGLLHQPLQLDAYDVSGIDLAAGWQLTGHRRQLVAEYDFGSRRFGGEPYVTFHRLLSSGWLRAGRVLLGGTYLTRFESYAAGWAPFDGVVQRGEVRAAVSPRRGLGVAVAYGLTRDRTDASVLRYVEHGPRAELRLSGGRRWRIGLDAAVSVRSYDEYDPTLQVTRRDTYLDATAWAEIDVAPGWAARLALDARRVTSNAPALEYDKLVPSIGLAYLRGFE